MIRVAGSPAPIRRLSKSATATASNTIIAARIAVTRSRFDNAVGKLYPFASRIHGSVSFDVTDEYPEYGAIGAYGVRGISAFEDGKMLPADGRYGFVKQRVYNIESSQFQCGRHYFACRRRIRQIDVDGWTHPVVANSVSAVRSLASPFSKSTLMPS